jgi:hypothetical protein
VTVFDYTPEDLLFERLSREFRDMLAQTGPAQPPEITVYEIAARA